MRAVQPRHRPIDSPTRARRRSRRCCTTRSSTRLTDPRRHSAGSKFELSSFRSDHELRRANVQRGLEALGQGDSATRTQKFKEAWKYESELEPAERNQLKDKLTLLQPSRLPAKAAAPTGELTPIQKAELETQEKTRRLFREVTAEWRRPNRSRTTAPLDALDQLERLRRRVDGAELDEQAKRSIAMMVDRSITQQKSYIEANRAKIDLDLQNEAVRNEMSTEQARESRIDEEVSALVDTFNELDQGTSLSGSRGDREAGSRTQAR